MAISLKERFEIRRGLPNIFTAVLGDPRYFLIAAGE